MNFQDAVRTCLQKFADFKGRATRPEFWWFVLAAFIAQMVAPFLAIISSSLASIVSLVIGLGLLIPTIAAGARRLHDTDRSGWLQFLNIVPLGIFVLIYFWTQPGTAGENRFGPPSA